MQAAKTIITEKGVCENHNTHQNTGKTNKQTKKEHLFFDLSCCAENVKPNKLLFYR